MSKLTINIESRPNGVYVVSFAGAAEVMHLPTLESQLNALLERKPARVVFDLAGLTFIASLTIGELIHFRTKAQAWKGMVQLCGSNELISNTIKRARIDVLLPIYSTVEAALGIK